jgi:cobalt-zinc-cadmium resistance protein CzcA
VREGHEIRRGAVTAQGHGEVVLGLAFMLAGENSRVVTQALESKMKEVRRSLPEDVNIEVVYNRVSLVDGVLETVRTNLLEGAILVIAVLFVLMGNLRAGLITALAIPLSMLFAFSAMLRFGIAGSLMSLGAIDFGLFVDSSLIMIENSSRRAAEDDGKRPFKEVIRDACMEVRRPTLFGEAIVMIVFLPILTLEGIEGKMFRPMALTFLFCLAGSSLLSLTLMPTLASFFLRRGGGPRKNLLMSALLWIYRPLLSVALKIPALVLLAAALLVGFTARIASDLGSEFVPELSEGSIVVNTVRLAGVSLEESVRYGTQLEKVLLAEFPEEVDRIWTRTGAPEVATDPMGLEVSDIFIRLKPRESWSRAETQEELVEKMSAALSPFPGMRVVFTQPIEMRMAEMVAGSRANLAIRILGDDLAELERIGTEVDALLRTIEGSADVRRDQLTGQPILQAKLNKSALARYGVAGSEVLDLIEAIGGLKVGEIREGERRFDLAIRLADRYRGDPEALRKVLVPAPNGANLPLEALVDLSFVEGPQTIRREWGKRQITIECNVRGRDIGSFVEEAREKILDGVSMPEGYFVEFGGQFEHLIAARRRLMFVTPLALALILVLLYLTYRSARDAILIFTLVPFAVVGGVFALYFRGLPFTISAGVGFIALSGIAIQNGLVVVSYTRNLMRRGSPLKDAVRESALVRLRPVLATAITDVAGFIPMAVSTGLGAEVQRPLATVVIGGVVSSTILTLFVLPAIYSVFGKELRDTGSKED